MVMRHSFVMVLLFACLADARGAEAEAPPGTRPRPHDSVETADEPARSAQRRRRRRRRDPARTEAETPPATTPPTTAEGTGAADAGASTQPAGAPAAEATTAAAGTGTASNMQRSSRMEFDARLVRGEAAGSGAVILFERAERALPSLTDRRSRFLERTIESLYRGQAIPAPTPTPRPPSEPAQTSPAAAPASAATPAAPGTAAEGGTVSEEADGPAD